VSGSARAPYTVIGHALPRPDAWEKVHGRPVYAGDFAVPGMLHGRIVRSPYASARIVALDVAAAAEVPGVVAVLTHADVPRNAMRMALPGRMAEATAEARPAFQPVLAEDRVRFQGEPVVAIAAETPEAAALAGERVRVEYEELPGVYDPLEALAAGASEVHPGGNLLHQWRLRRGDIEEGFRRADVTVEHTYHTPFIDHAYMETETGVGWIDAEGVVVLRVSTQVLEHFRDVADVLDVPHGRVRIEGAYLGGGFGGKEDVTVECLLGLLVWRTRRPVQLVFSREESFIGHGKRHPYVIRYRTGATRRGELTAVAAELTSDSGAYAALSPWVLLYSLVTATGPYRVPNVAVDARTVYTNNPIASAYRTFGSIQTCLAYESQMDALAAALRMDPLELRERNFLRKGDSIGTGQVLESEPMLAETMRRAWAALGPPRASTGPRRIGRGLAASITPYGRMCWTRDSASAWVGMELDGTAVVRCAAPDVGGGQTASLCSIVAEVLGLDPGRVTAIGRDSHFTPRAGTTTATRQLYMSGNAVLKAARALREHLVAQAAEMLEAAPTDIALIAGQAIVRGTRRGVPIASVVQTASASGRPVQVLEKFDAPAADTIDPETGQGKAFNDFTFGTQAVEVEVDEETGRVRATRIAACYDVGQTINRHSAEGQVEGGVIQGLGHALLEEVVLEQGVSKNPHLFDYKIPSTLDAPPVQTILLESGQGLGPFGAKGIGEPAMTPTPGAVLNAVSAAVGRRITACPVTAERVLAALRRPE
jgi:CO/xanthine dehydrogenase Mo-binding subunit